MDMRRRILEVIIGIKILLSMKKEQLWLEKVHQILYLLSLKQWDS